MRKPAFCIFLWPLYSDIIFFIDHYCAGGYQISIAYNLFSFKVAINSSIADLSWDRGSLSSTKIIFGA